MARRLLSVLIIFALTLPSSAWAAGFTMPEQGQPGVGTATVGSAAEANDASTVFFNPAGMTNLERSEVLMGSEILFGNIRFSSDADIPNPFRGDDGGNAGLILPGGGFYYAQNLYDHKIWGGIAMNSLAGLGLEYHDDWRGRYLIQDSFLAVLNLNPSLALKLTDWLSFGGGVSVIYTIFKQHTAIPKLPLESGDGQVYMDFDDWQVGYNLGLLLTPREGTRAGVAYRSATTLKLSGDLEFTGVGPIMDKIALENNFASTKITIPHSIMVSLYQDITDKLALLGDVGWQNWSSMQKTCITTVSGATLSLNRDWIDTWHIGIGVHYRLFKPLLLRAGVSYDSSPANDTNRLPDLAIDRQWKYAAGLDYSINKDWTVSAAWEFTDLGPAPIDQQISAGTLFPGRQFRGDYSQYINLVMLSVSYKFGSEPDPAKKGKGLF